MSGMNYQKQAARDRARIGGSPKTTREVNRVNWWEAATKPQKKYVADLANRAGVPCPQVRTKRQAGEAIVWLKAMPANKNRAAKQKRPRRKPRARGNPNRWRSNREWMSASEFRAVEAAMEKKAA